VYFSTLGLQGFQQPLALPRFWSLLAFYQRELLELVHAPPRAPYLWGTWNIKSARAVADRALQQWQESICADCSHNLEKSLSRTSWRYQLCRPRWPMGRGTILRAKVDGDSSQSGDTLSLLDHRRVTNDGCYCDPCGGSSGACHFALCHLARSF